MSIRARLHRLIDGLPEGKHLAAERLLLQLLDSDEVPSLTTWEEFDSLRFELALLRAGGPTPEEVLASGEPTIAADDLIRHLRQRGREPDRLD